MDKKYKVITLCGSTRFKEEFLEVQRILTLEGNIVLSVGVFSKYDKIGQNIITGDIQIMLNDLHRRKIDMSDEIFVINKNRYIGDNTKNEIEYATSKNKPVKYLE